MTHEKFKKMNSLNPLYGGAQGWVKANLFIFLNFSTRVIFGVISRLTTFWIRSISGRTTSFKHSHI